MNEVLHPSFNGVERSLLIECLLEWLSEGFTSNETKIAEVKRLIVALGGEVELRKYERFVGC